MISKIKLTVSLLLIAMFLFSSIYITPVNASNDPVKVWFSSEYKPKDHGWYTNNWESNITFKLSLNQIYSLHPPMKSYYQLLL